MGESEAIALARQIRADQVLIDDREAVTIARRTRPFSCRHSRRGLLENDVSCPGTLDSGTLKT